MVSGNPPPGDGEHAQTATDQSSDGRRPFLRPPARPRYDFGLRANVDPEADRFCRNCGQPLGRGSTPLTGSCPNCGTRYSFEPRLRPHQVVADRYEVLRTLTLGTWGGTYLAWDRHVLDRPVALVELFDASSRPLLTRLDHPLIPELYDVVFVNETDYVVTEYVNGTPLRERVQPLPVATVVDYGMAILSAVGHLHEHDLAVGDLTLDNVIETGGQLKLIGLGQFLPRTDTSVAADLVAVGRLMVKLAAGHKPVAADSYARFLRRVSDPRPGHRFDSAEEMATQLVEVRRELSGHNPNTASTRFGPPERAFGANPMTDFAGLPPSCAEIAAGLPEPRDTQPWRAWRSEWDRGLALLLLVKPAEAREAFDTVCDLLLSEPAPRLALAACLEWLGEWAAAERYYELVWRMDPAHVSAAFGLARIRLAYGDPAAAVLALDLVPDDSPHHVAAQAAKIVISVDRSAEHKIRDAAGRLLGETDRLQALLALLEATYTWLRSKPEGYRPAAHSIFEWPLTEQGLRAGIEQLRHALAKQGTRPRWQAFVEGLAESFGAVPRRRRSRRSGWERIEARIHERYRKLGPPMEKDGLR